MTRLKTDDITDIADRLPQYDAQLLRQTGRTLKGIACQTVGFKKENILSPANQIKVSVVPFSCGHGVINGFTHAVAQIAAYMGFTSYVAEDTDIKGLVDAFDRKADIIFLADDEQFAAINLRTGYVSDNGEMTAKGFVTGLELMAGGLKNRRVLVLGCGVVGRAAVKTLLTRGAAVAVYDVAASQSHELITHIKGKVKIETDLRLALKRYHLLFDAAPAKNIIGADAVTAKTFVAAPGMPCGVTPQAFAKLGERLLHDPLQIGVACMLMDAVGQ
jgi:pyrrolysine biosynthesis protein PylD